MLAYKTRRNVRTKGKAVNGRSAACCTWHGGAQQMSGGWKKSRSREGTWGGPQREGVRGSSITPISTPRSQWNTPAGIAGTPAGVVLVLCEDVMFLLLLQEQFLRTPGPSSIARSPVHVCDLIYLKVSCQANAQEKVLLTCVIIITIIYFLLCSQCLQ